MYIYTVKCDVTSVTCLVVGSRVYYLKIPLISRCHYHNILKDFAVHVNHSSPEVADKLQLSWFHAEQRLRMVAFVINYLSNS